MGRIVIIRDEQGRPISARMEIPPPPPPPVIEFVDLPEEPALYLVPKPVEADRDGVLCYFHERDDCQIEACLDRAEIARFQRRKWEKDSGFTAQNSKGPLELWIETVYNKAAEFWGKDENIKQGKVVFFERSGNWYPLTAAADIKKAAKGRL